MFWGLELKANQAHQLTPGNALLTITNICLVAPGSVAVKAKGVTIAVLNDSKPQARLFLKCSSDTALQATGSGTVHICGYRIAADDDSEVAAPKSSVAQLMKEAQILKDDQHMEDVYNKALKNIKTELRKQNWDDVDWEDMK